MLTQIYGCVCTYAMLLLFYVPVRSHRLFRTGVMIEGYAAAAAALRVRLLRSVAMILGLLVCVRTAGAVAARPASPPSDGGAAYWFFEAYGTESILWGLALVALCLAESLVMDLVLAHKLKANRHA